MRLFALGAVTLALCLMVRRLDFHAFKVALRAARGGMLLLAAGFGVAHLWCKAWLWCVLLDSKGRVSTARMFRYTVAAVAASVLTPARAGEVLRIWLLKRHHNIPYRQSAGSALTEKYLDVVGLLVLAAPLPWLAPVLPPWLGRTLLGLTGLVLVAVVVALLARRQLNPRGQLAVLLKRIAVLPKGPTFLRALAVTGCATAFDLGALWLSLIAVGIHLGFAGVTIVLLVTNVAIAIPVMPGNIGSLEAGAVLGLLALAVPRSQAVAFALLYHAVQLVPLLGLALFNLRLIFGARRTLSIPALDLPRL